MGYLCKIDYLCYLQSTGEYLFLNVMGHYFCKIGYFWIAQIANLAKVSYFIQRSCLIGYGSSQTFVIIAKSHPLVQVLHAVGHTTHLHTKNWSRPCKADFAEKVNNCLMNIGCCKKTPTLTLFGFASSLPWLSPEQLQRISLGNWSLSQDWTLQWEWVWFCEWLLWFIPSESITCLLFSSMWWCQSRGRQGVQLWQK